jgi:hypothetical protein
MHLVAHLRIKFKVTRKSFLDIGKVPANIKNAVSHFNIFLSPAINQLCFRSVEHKKRHSSELLQQHLLFKSFYLAESFLFAKKILI